MSRNAVDGSASERICQFLANYGPEALVITGAGCSTESGIPDYRSPSGIYRRPNFKPLLASTFLASEWQRRRYWGRSMVGFGDVRDASCNLCHMAVQRLATCGVIDRIVTQNVDGLHHLAANGGTVPPDLRSTVAATRYQTESTASLTELHGNIHLVKCINCARITSRRSLQVELVAQNREVFDEVRDLRSVVAEADGDSTFPDRFVDRIHVPPCEACGGILRPHVVLFGENVPGGTVASIYEKVDSAPCMLCLGTSLTVFSSFRFVAAFAKLGKPVCIVNNGTTRADALDGVTKVETTSIATVMNEVQRQLLG